MNAAVIDNVAQSTMDLPGPVQRTVEDDGILIVQPSSVREFLVAIHVKRRKA